MYYCSKEYDNIFFSLADRPQNTCQSLERGQLLESLELWLSYRGGLLCGVLIVLIFRVLLDLTMNLEVKLGNLLSLLYPTKENTLSEEQR